MILGAKIKKKQNVESVFDKAWEITSSWEGDYKSGGGGAGNNFNGINYGTQYGITASFARNFGGITLSNSDVIRNLTKDKCKELWKKVLWDKMILGDKINNEKVAILLFDSCVHLQTHLDEIAVRDKKGEGPIQSWTRGFVINFICDEYDKENPPIDRTDWTGFTKRVKVNEHFKGKSKLDTDKASVLTLKAIKVINDRCEKDAQGFFDRLNAARKIAESGWVAKKRGMYTPYSVLISH
jgi:hypothetical protein